LVGIKREISLVNEQPERKKRLIEAYVVLPIIRVMIYMEKGFKFAISALYELF